MLYALAIVLSAQAHPSVDGHLHASEVRCDPGEDPMVGTIAAIRRAGVLSDAGRTSEALAELEAACLPDAEVTRLARARTWLRGGNPSEALIALDGLEGADASLWRAQAYLALGREEEAGALLVAVLSHLPDAPPETYLQTASLVPPCTAVEVLALARTRRGDIGSLRRAAATASWTCHPERDDALEQLRPDVVRDALLAGDLLADRARWSEARARWTAAQALLTQQRDTPARHAMEAELTQRLNATDAP